jgi:drug/metabolite transporter (DMT)-like permease
MNKFLLVIPALCDFITSTLHYIALNFVSGSIYQMMRGGTIVTTFVFSITILKIKVQPKMIIGSSLAVVGVVVVGVSNLMFSSATSSDDGVFYIFNLG